MNNIIKIKNWLKDSAIPLWTKHGIEQQSGCFIESINFDGTLNTDSDRRAMVQARQIYSFCEAHRLGLIESTEAEVIVSKNIQFLLKTFKNKNGSYNHAVNKKLEICDTSNELYTQAFVIFALAHAYSLLGDKNLVNEALEILIYLKRERKNISGGYTEIKSGKTLFQSNPHMHLFEAALAWCTFEGSQPWVDLANELKDLCTNKFINKKTGLLAEHFNSEWQPICDDNGFIFEPGHHYEWSWLFLEYQRIFKKDMLELSLILYHNADQYGLSENKAFVFDEVYSSLETKKNSSRFWPQSERIKAAVSLGLISTLEDQKNQYFKSADIAIDSLFEYLNTDTKGLWYDTRFTNGKFNIEQPAKASSLYHIINAFSEYLNKR